MSAIVAVDASVLVWMLEPEPEDDVERLKAWTNVREAMRQLRDAGSVFVVPAPAMAELHSGPTGSLIASLLAQRSSRMRVEPLDYHAAELAGEMIAKAPRPRPPALSRNVVKYDALIAAIAHRLGAAALVTADERGFPKYLNAVSSTVRVEIATLPRGQLRLLRT